MKKKIFIIFFIAIVILGFILGKTPETSLLKAVLPANASDLVKLSEKYSGTVNVIFEAKDYISCEKLKLDFVAGLDSEMLGNDDYQQILDDYKKFPKNFLSDKNRSLLLNKDYDAVFNNAQAELYNPFAMFLLPIEDDPMFLFSDFINSLAQKQTFYKTELNDKFYSVLTLKSGLDNKNIKYLFALQKKFSKENERIYLTGSPVHSYVTSQKSAFEINIAAILSSIFVIGLIFFYFRNIKVVIPVVISILSGITAGYFLTAAIFRNVHVLTFVFSTSLIGICVDYSLHYFVEKNTEKLSKSLKISLITTVAAFLVLLFSKIPLLSQIAVFTPTGLIIVYFIVTLFYKDLKFDLSKQIQFPNFDFKNYKILSVLLAVFIVFGLSKLSFSNDIKLMYKPDKNLANAEKTLSELKLGKEKNIILVKGSDIERILQKEEKIKNKVPSVSLSDFVPSIARQSENSMLVDDLYLHKLYDCSMLSENNIMALLSQKPQKFLVPDFEKYPFLENFMLDKNTSVMFADGCIEDGDVNVRCINLAKDISDLLDVMQRHCFYLIFCVFVFLILYLYKNYQKNAFILILPSVLGVLAGFAALGVFGININLFHIFAVFLVLGFTVDYSIFRFSQIEKSKDAVLISCLTTAFSFLMISFTSFKLISSLGLFLFFGILTSYIFSYIFINSGADDEVV